MTVRKLICGIATSGTGPDASFCLKLVAYAPLSRYIRYLQKHATAGIRLHNHHLKNLKGNASEAKAQARSALGASFLVHPDNGSCLPALDCKFVRVRGSTCCCKQWTLHPAAEIAHLTTAFICRTGARTDMMPSTSWAVGCHVPRSLKHPAYPLWLQAWWSRTSS